MSENNNPAATPATPGQAPGQAPAPANNTPAANPQGQPQGGNNGGAKIEMDQATVEKLKRDAGRWEAYQKKARDERRNNRGNRNPEYQDLDGAAPEVLEALRSRDDKLNELSLTNRELAVKDKVRDLFDSEEYKSIPIAVKKAITRNPLGFVNRTSESLEDAIADIQDYLDEELDHPTPSNDEQKPPAPVDSQENHQVPPIAGSGPASPNAAPDADTAGKTGPARSTAILGNLLKNKK